MRAMRRLTLTVCSFAAMLVVTGAQAQGVRSESYIAGRNPAQLFASDCTGSGCHSGPQGLAKGKQPNDLAAYLRAHYTDSRQTAAALAAYLMGVRDETPAARRGKPERIERVERPMPQEPQDRALREERDWLPFRLPNLFGRQEAEEPPQQEAAPPPARTPQRSRSAAKPEQPARTSSERAAPSAREEPPQPSEGSLFSAFSALFGREEETKAAPEPAKPAPRTRQTSRQPPKTEEVAKPSSDEPAPPRTRPSTRRPPKPEAKPEAAEKPLKPKEAAKPPVSNETAAPAQTRQTTRRPPKTEETLAPTNTETVAKRARRTEPLFPVTEDNAGPPPASEIYRPVRRDPTSPGAGSDQVVAPGEVLPPAREAGPRLPIFD